MKKFLSIFFAMTVFGFVSCGDDDNDSQRCATCEIQGQTLPEACEGENGNAFIAGQDTGTSYDDYVSATEAAGGTCN